MKKIGLLGMLLGTFLLFGCSNIDRVDTNELEPINIPDAPFESESYEGTLEIRGVGPEISLEPVEEGTLVALGSFEDHSDHIYFTSGSRESYLSNENDFLPGNKINFKGNVEFIDGAAGNHYYNVSNITELNIQDYPSESEINNILESYNYCESDSDCGLIQGKCPFKCGILINQKFANVSMKIIDNHINSTEAKCIQDCIPYTGSIKCQDYKCIIN